MPFVDYVTITQQILNEDVPAVAHRVKIAAGEDGIDPVGFGCGYTRYGVEMMIQVGKISPELAASYLRALADAVASGGEWPALRFISNQAGDVL
ncbi:hypothetical protein [Azospirillum sp. BE72]|uniref:hypothetical protein n=1 Tax=Azospirillum sp. BE72 TaxID=2817776 RepID=UPI0028571C03|nr:hypothetical protein [Azospirillum sp. BE72]MDR6775726.1 hypothetical protein [Azospirillum sp. BE72]